MVRTSRGSAPAANVDALDNLSLDIFGDQGDALFDGIDVDLDGIDELMGGDGDPDTHDQSSPAARLPMPLPAPAAPAPGSRRTTTRKSKTPAFLEDAADEDFLDEPAPATKKKRKKSKATTSSSKKKAAGTPSILPIWPMR